MKRPTHIIKLNKYFWPLRILMEETRLHMECCCEWHLAIGMHKSTLDKNKSERTDTHTQWRKRRKKTEEYVWCDVHMVSQFVWCEEWKHQHQIWMPLFAHLEICSSMINWLKRMRVQRFFYRFVWTCRRINCGKVLWDRS